MGWILYRHSDRSKIQYAFAENAGIEAALDRLEEMRQQGWDVKVVDTSESTDEQRRQFYLKQTGVSGVTHHAIHGVFGSDRYPEMNFGTGVPALEIESLSDKDPGDIYPHRDKDRPVSILDFLKRTDHLRAVQAATSATASDISEAMREIMRDNSKALEETLTSKGRD